MDQKYLGKYRPGTKRLIGFDYTSPVSYFITLNVLNKRKLFGKIEDGKMKFSELGEVVTVEWLKTIEIRKSLDIDLSEFVVMPDHFHAMITINPRNEKTQFSPNVFGIQSQNIGSIIRGFKAAVTTYARKNDIDFDWQPRYHDRVIRDPYQYENVRKYIRDNVKNWKDK